MTICGLTLKQTCGACPEQYDVLDGDDVIGYFRLRHGHFTAEYVRGDHHILVYSSCPMGDGEFEDYEREFQLTCAVIELIKVDRIAKLLKTKGKD